MWKNLPGKNCRWEGAIAKLQVKNLHVRRYKNFCRWGAIPILLAVAMPHPSELFLSPFLIFFVKMTFHQLGGYDHTAAQLTEGRSALDISKQLPEKKSTTAMDTARCRNLSIGFTYHNEATFFIIYLDTLRHAATSQKIFALFDFFCGSWYPSFLQISASSLLQPTRLRTWSTMVQKTKFVREENTLIGDFMAIASPSPLFRWLKCDLPGTYLSSCQSKKVERRHCAF